jgi:hypothetical protein
VDTAATGKPPYPPDKIPVNPIYKAFGPNLQRAMELFMFVGSSGPQAVVSSDGTRGPLLPQNSSSAGLVASHEESLGLTGGNNEEVAFGLDGAATTTAATTTTSSTTPSWGQPDSRGVYTYRPEGSSQVVTGQYQNGQFVTQAFNYANNAYTPAANPMTYYQSNSTTGQRAGYYGYDSKGNGVYNSGLSATGAAYSTSYTGGGANKAVSYGSTGTAYIPSGNGSYNVTTGNNYASTYGNYQTGQAKQAFQVLGNGASSLASNVSSGFGSFLNFFGGGSSQAATSNYGTNRADGTPYNGAD